MLRETTKKNQFKLGVNFDYSLLSAIIKLNNENNENKVTELYGSIAKHAELAARPDFRLPKIEDEDLERYVALAKANGIDFNYTLNSFMPYGSKVEFNKNPNEFLLTHDFGEDFKELNEVPIDQIFTFKNIWNSLSDENKNILINYIKGLNKLAHKYIDSD